MAIEYPEGAQRQLRLAWKQRRLTPFLGAGVSAPYGLPQWQDLVMRILIDESWQAFGEFWKNYQTPLAVWMSENFDFGLESLARFAKSRFAVNTGSGRRRDFNDYVASKIYERSPEERPPGETALTAVADLIAASEAQPGGRAIPAVVTLNFDDLLERELALRAVEAEAVYDGRRRRPAALAVIHAHGFLPRGRRAPASDLIFTEDDYNRFALQTVHWAQVELMSRLRNGTAVFIGMSMSDTNLRRLLDATRDGRGMRHFAVRRRLQLTPEARREAAERIHKRAMTGLKPAERKKMESQAATLEWAIERMLAEARGIDTALLKEMGVGTVWVDDFGEIGEVLRAIPS
jgi:hypothetical protein